MEFPLPVPGKFTIYSKSGCFYCNKVKALLQEYEEYNCDEYLLEDREGFLAFIASIAGREYKTFPMVFNSSGEFVGGFAETKALLETPKLSFNEAF
jgi:glutaredoxin